MYDDAKITTDCFVVMNGVFEKDGGHHLGHCYGFRGLSSVIHYAVLPVNTEVSFRLFCFTSRVPALLLVFLLVTRSGKGQS